jgi:hypothetical protein
MGRGKRCKLNWGSGRIIAHPEGDVQNILSRVQTTFAPKVLPFRPVSKSPADMNHQKDAEFALLECLGNGDVLGVRTGKAIPIKSYRGVEIEEGRPRFVVGL